MNCSRFFGTLVWTDCSGDGGYGLVVAMVCMISIRVRVRVALIPHC